MAEADALQAARVPVEVAVGVLIDAQGRFLLTSRPPGKVYAGYWEFPGGKLEPGESVEEALRRELHEEIGVTIGHAEPWRVEIFDYPHARVRLHFCRVREWTGRFEMREGQQMSWERLPVGCAPVLPGTAPVLEWLAAEAAPDRSVAAAATADTVALTATARSAPSAPSVDAAAPAG